MKEILKLAFILAIMVASNFIAIYFHDKNIVQQCNSRGYTDSMLGVRRLDCLQVDSK